MDDCNISDMQAVKTFKTAGGVKGCKLWLARCSQAGTAITNNNTLKKSIAGIKREAVKQVSIITTRIPEIPTSMR